MSDHVQGDRQLVARLEAVKRTPRNILRRWQVRTVQLAKIAAPKRTGNLQRSIRMGRLGVTSATVEAGADYAGYVEFGTRPHRIVPRLKRVLAWNSNAGAARLSGSLRSGMSPNVFVRYVDHPGTKAHPFLDPSARQALDEVGNDDVVKAWNEAA